MVPKAPTAICAVISPSNSFLNYFNSENKGSFISDVIQFWAIFDRLNLIFSTSVLVDPIIVAYCNSGKKIYLNRKASKQTNFC